MILISEDIEMACHKAATLKFIRAHGTLGRTPRYNAKLNIHERISEYAESLASEFVVARELGIDYDLNYDGFKQFADVGSNIEVRWTRWNVGHLIVYPTDRDDDIAILVCGKSLQIIGSLAGSRSRSHALIVTSIHHKIRGGSINIISIHYGTI
jgi:hypothetical protein